MQPRVTQCTKVFFAYLCFDERCSELWEIAGSDAPSNLFSWQHDGACPPSPPDHLFSFCRLSPPPALHLRLIFQLAMRCAGPTSSQLRKAATLRLSPIISLWTHRSSAQTTACGPPLFLLNCRVQWGVLLRVSHFAYSLRTPLHWSAIYGHVQICEALLLSGADVNARNKR